MRLNPGEQLDVIGLVKRVAGGTRPYPSVSRVAADPWLRRIPKEELDPLASLCPSALKHIELSPQKGVPKYGHFPVEGTAVYRSRYNELQEELKIDPTIVQQMQNGVAHLVKKYGEPSPYLCVLVADGDKMGETISTIDTPDHHRDFSHQLSTFAADARAIVQDNCGVLVYAGGDDVLAFLPVDLALSCAWQLAERFKKIRAGLSLSVGLAVGHFMEPLEDLLSYGREAEKHSKKPRPNEAGNEKDALAVHVAKRGGSPVEMRANWQSRPDLRLTRLAQWLSSGSVSQAMAYQLRQVADLYIHWPPATVANAIQKDVLSILKGKSPAGESRIAEISEMIVQQVDSAMALRSFSTEILVARAFAGGMK